MNMAHIDQNVLLLDIGGTLVDITEPYDVYTERAVANVVNFVQPEIDSEEAKKIALDVRRKIRDHAHATLEENDFLVYTASVFQRWGINKWNDQAAIEAEYIKAELEITKLFDDTLEFLERAKSSGKRIVALTNNFSALHVETLLERFGLKPYFSDIFISASFDLRKPSLEFMELVFKDLNVSRSEAIVIGDKVEMDVEAGRRSGVATCLVTRGSDPEGQEKADIIVRTLADIEF